MYATSSTPSAAPTSAPTPAPTPTPTPSPISTCGRCNVFRLTLLGTVSLVIIVIALAIALGVEQRKDARTVTVTVNQIQPSNTGVLAANGCRYSNAAVVAMLGMISEFNACAGNPDDLFTWSFKTCFWDMSSKASNPDLQKVVKLETAVAAAIKEGGVTTMEKVQLGLVLRELRIWKKLVTKGVIAPRPPISLKM